MTLAFLEVTDSSIIEKELWKESCVLSKHFSTTIYYILQLLTWAVDTYKYFDHGNGFFLFVFTENSVKTIYTVFGKLSRRQKEKKVSENTFGYVNSTFSIFWEEKLKLVKMQLKLN